MQINPSVEMSASAVEMISAGAAVVSALGIVLVWWQTRLLRSQVLADHERSRRELTVSLIQRWNQGISPVSAAAERLVNQFDEPQCRDLEHLRPFSISEKHRALLETCVSEGVGKEEQVTSSGGTIVLTQRQVARLRFLVLDYLNETEAVLLAWKMSIVDRELIEHEFQFICDSRLGYDALERLRNVVGGEKLFPAITEFVQHIRAKSTKATPSRPSLPIP